MPLPFAPGRYLRNSVARVPRAATFGCQSAVIEVDSKVPKKIESPLAFLFDFSNVVAPLREREPEGADISQGSKVF